MDLVSPDPGLGKILINGPDNRSRSFPRNIRGLDLGEKRASTDKQGEKGNRESKQDEKPVDFFKTNQRKRAKEGDEFQ